MRFTTRITSSLALCCVAGALSAQMFRTSHEVDMTFSVQLLGLPIGRMQLAGQEGVMNDGQGGYFIRSTFATRGLASLVNASFVLSAKGRINDGRLAPRAYVEKINTGNRRSTARLDYKGGVPHLTSGSVAAEVAADPNALDAAAQGGTVDPLTALYGVLRDRPKPGLCRYDVTIFDGQRRARLAMTGRSQTGRRVTCAGAYTRLAGFSVSELKRQTVYPFTVTYIPSGGVMRAQALTVRTSYGAAVLARQE